jgi:two-component system, cell cycle sensor histidine kinase PleC
VGRFWIVGSRAVAGLLRNRRVDAVARSRYARREATVSAAMGEQDEIAQTLRKIAQSITSGLPAPSRDPPVTGMATPPAPAPNQAYRHVAQLAHELKTPLSAIAAAAEIMRDERLGPIGDPRYKDYAAAIFDSASHALGVISVMLGSATPTGAQTGALSLTHVDVNELAERLTGSVRALVEAAGLTIDHDLAPRLPRVVADATSVRQIVLNLVTNAIRAAPSGGRIRLQTTYELAGPVCLAVSDTGSGMTTGEIAAALDPAGVPNFEIKPGGGLGLGYPLLRGLARANGATVSIASGAEWGTTVTITFPPERVIPV